MLKSEATRARILESALAIFRERGFEKSTMREIATAAGVAVGAAYYYFDSKDAIVMAFYQRAQQEMAPSLDAILSEEKTLEARLRGIIALQIRIFLAQSSIARRPFRSRRSHSCPIPLQCGNRRHPRARHRFFSSVRWKTPRSSCPPIFNPICHAYSGFTKWA